MFNKRRGIWLLLENVTICQFESYPSLTTADVFFWRTTHVGLGNEMFALAAAVFDISISARASLNTQRTL